MNNTIKYLLEKEVRRQIVVTYDNQPTIDKSRVDVKNGYIRFGIAIGLLTSCHLPT